MENVYRPVAAEERTQMASNPSSPQAAAAKTQPATRMQSGNTTAGQPAQKPISTEIKQEKNGLWKKLLIGAGSFVTGFFVDEIKTPAMTETPVNPDEIGDLPLVENDAVPPVVHHHNHIHAITVEQPVAPETIATETSGIPHSEPTSEEVSGDEIIPDPVPVVPASVSMPATTTEEIPVESKSKAERVNDKLTDLAEQAGIDDIAKIKVHQTRSGDYKFKITGENGARLKGTIAHESLEPAHATEDHQAIQNDAHTQGNEGTQPCMMHSDEHATPEWHTTETVDTIHQQTNESLSADPDPGMNGSHDSIPDQFGFDDSLVQTPDMGAASFHM